MKPKTVPGKAAANDGRTVKYSAGEDGKPDGKAEGWAAGDQSGRRSGAGSKGVGSNRSINE